MYNKSKYHKNPEARIKYQIQSHHENSEKQTDYQKKRCKRNPEIQRESSRKRRYQENPGIQREYQKRRYQENPEIHNKYRKERYQEKKRLRNIENFLQQIKQGPYYICTVCHRSLYQRSVRLFKPEKYHVLTADLYHPVKSYDEKFNICETCHKHLHKNEIPCQTVCNKMALDVMPDELRYLRKLEKVLISKRLLFKKIAIMHGKGEFSKIKGSICNIPVEAANICNILPRPAVSNGLIVVKLKRDLKYRGHVYFEPVRPNIIYQALTYLKLHNKFYKDIFIAKSLSSEGMFKFSDIVEIQGETESVTEKKYFRWKSNDKKCKLHQK